MGADITAHVPPPSDAQDAARTAGRAQPAPHAQRRLRVHTDALLDGNNEIEIQHGEAVYRLRITSLGKLILTK